MIVAELQKRISAVLEKLGVVKPAVHFEHPAELSHGDYSTNVALMYAKELKMKPRELAEGIVEKLKVKSFTFVEKIEIAGVGFINFYLSSDFFIESIKRIDADFGKNTTLTGQKVMVEYTDPNPFKEFHIGHLMSNAIGEAISRLIEAEGAEVKRACYQGDVGLHVAKALYGILKMENKIPLELESLSVKVSFLGKAYALGAERYEKDETAAEEIKALNKTIYLDDGGKVGKIYYWGRNISLDYFDVMYKRLGTWHGGDRAFNFYFFESESGLFGKEIVEKLIGKVFEKSDGAVVYKGEKAGLHTRVFINSQGLPTYEAKELGLAKKKYEVYPYDKSIIITSNEVNEYFKVLLSAMKEVFPELAAKTIHRPHGMLRLPSGKMSSRKGEVITAEALITKVEDMVREKIQDRELPEGEKHTIGEKVAVGAIKYSILRQSVGGDIIFDFEKSISFEGDSGPYLMYSFARATSVLRKAGKGSLTSIPIEVRLQPIQIGLLERLLYRFPEVMERAAEEYEPHYVATYLTELAGAFNAWYAKERIIEAGEEAPYRLMLTQAFAAVMKNGLSLLGIPVLEQM